MAKGVWLHRYAIFLACCTLLLIFAGGMVTSTGSGLSVPDWPLSYGQVFPPMVGGIFYEHGHRMIAATVGFLTIIMAIWLWQAEDRRWMRYLGLAGLLAVIIQGTLGGLTVLFLLPIAISVSHAGVAQLFLAITVSIAVFTSRWWRETSSSVADVGSPPLRTWTKVVTGMIYIQTLLGALMRHSKSGLAIPDWPLSYGRIIPPHLDGKILINFLHRTWGLVVAAAAIALVVALLRRHSENALKGPAMLLLCVVCTQVILGGLTVWSAKAEVLTTFHVAGGALTLACSLLLTLIVHRRLQPGAAARAIPLDRPGVATE